MALTCGPARKITQVVYIPGTCAAGQYGLAGNCSSTANYANRRTLQLLNPTWASYSTIAYVDGGAVAEL